MKQKLKLVKNAAGRKVPTTVNGMNAVPYKGVGKHSPKGVKAAPPIRSCNNYPASGNKIANSLKSTSNSSSRGIIVADASMIWLTSLIDE